MTRCIALPAAAVLAAFTATGADAALTISTDPTQNVVCSGGLCASTFHNAVLNRDMLASLLASGDVRVATQAGAKSIVVASPLTWASAHRLTLDANVGLTVDAQVAVAGPGGVRILINDGGSGGDLSFAPGGKIDFSDLTSSLVVNTHPYVLKADIATLAGAVAANPAGFFALANDYDAQADGTYGQAAIITPFAGTFEGLGHTIDNLAFHEPTHTKDLGLFAVLAAGTLRDIRLSHVSIQFGHAVGALAALNQGGTIDGVAMDGSVLGGTATGAPAGGLVGANTGTILNADANLSGFQALGDGGGIAGTSDGLLAHCQVEGIVTGQQRIGGLAGFAKGMIEDSVVTADAITTQGVAGGIAGVGQDITILRVSTSGKTVADFGQAPENRSPLGMLGGVVGVLSNGTIADSHAGGDVDGVSISLARPMLLGGLVGETMNASTIQRSYATGMIVAPHSGVEGGLVGLLDATSTVSQSFAGGHIFSNTGAQANVLGGLVGQNAGAISQSYATGAVTSKRKHGRDGGLVGENSGTIAQAYSTGTVFGGTLRGASIGDDEAAAGSITADYWDTTTSFISDPSLGAGNIANDPGITALTDAQLKAGLPAGFDPAVWAENAAINSGRPYLLANPPS
jgi:M26 IgA1-specific Metallo-endopeptidase N-terminal region